MGTRPLGGFRGATPSAWSATSRTGEWDSAQQFKLNKDDVWPGPPPEGYNVFRSLRFNSADSADLSRTPGSSGNRKTWTLSAWVKRSKLGGFQAIFSTPNGTSDTTWLDLGFESDRLLLAGYSTYWRITSQVFRDVSGWYHVVVSVDTTQATANNRIKLYVNGTEITAFSTTSNMNQNDNTGVNAASVHHFGKTGGTPHYLDSYLAETHFVDGQALTPSDFAETDGTTGQWIPKKYTGTYGTNGFYLNFSDNSGTTSTTLGKDNSGNSNNWTPNNFSVTAGAGNDSLVDSPTSFNTDTGVGGEVRGNYCTLNPLDGTGLTANFYLSNGNLDLNVSNNSGYRNVRATFSPENLKGYFECVYAGTANGGVGFAYESIARSNLQYNSAGTFYISQGGDVLNGATTIKAGCTSAFSVGDVIQVAFDFTGGARNVWFGRNGTWGSNSVGIGVPNTGTNPVLTVSNIAEISGLYFGINTGGALTTLTVNFGQRPFAYTAPTGFKALVGTNLPEPTIVKGNSYMDTVLWAGDNANPRTISGLNFSPDLVWLKDRTQATNHRFVDTLRGGNKTLKSNTIDAETSSESAGTISAFTSDGFTLAGTSTMEGVNLTGDSYVAWCWDESATPGFDIVTFNGTGATQNVSHSLGVAPKMVLVKSRGATGDWWVYHESIGATKTLFLSLTDAALTFTAAWNNTAPTSSVFTVGAASGLNANGVTQVAYLWSEVAGFSKFGSYTGNGSSDGPFVFLGFRPRWIMIKRTDSSANWQIYDTARDTGNKMFLELVPNSSAEENSVSLNIGVGIDALSNGFKLRDSHTAGNASGGTYIFAAYAESPFKYARAR